MNNNFKIDEAISILYNTMDFIKKRTHYDDILIDNESDTSCSILDNQGDHMIIGTRYLYTTSYNGVVNNDAFAYLLATPFHEERHTYQRYKMADPILRKSDPQLQRMLLDTKLSNYFPEYYTISYFDNIAEMDAERYALQQSSKFFSKNKELIKGFLFNKYLTNSINNTALIQKWFADRPIHDIKDAEQRLELKMNEKLNDNKPFNGITSAGNPYMIPTIRPLMKEMSQRQLEKLETADTLQKQQAIMIRKIYAYQHDEFRQCADIMPGTTKLYTYLNESLTDQQIQQNRHIPQSEYPSFMQNNNNDKQDDDDSPNF